MAIDTGTSTCGSKTGRRRLREPGTTRSGPIMVDTAPANANRPPCSSNEVSSGPSDKQARNFRERNARVVASWKETPELQRTGCWALGDVRVGTKY
jgi:hypothetical protein